MARVALVAAFAASFIAAVMWSTVVINRSAPDAAAWFMAGVNALYLATALWDLKAKRNQRPSDK